LCEKEEVFHVLLPLILAGICSEFYTRVLQKYVRHVSSELMLVLSFTVAYGITEGL